MDLALLGMALAMIAFTSIIIMYACDGFEDAADYLGRNMKPGVKGATINAIASSLPELFTTTILLFGPVYFPDVFGSRADGFSAGIATTAGSAVFNAVIIPALCILAVMIWGVKRSDGTRERVKVIRLNKKVAAKDGFFFLLGEFALIFFLADAVMEWWMGAALAGIYLVYIGITLGLGFAGDDDDEDGDDDDDEEDDHEDEGVGILGLGWLLNFNDRLNGGQEFNDARAWKVIFAATFAIAVACAGIAWAVEQSAHALGVAPYFTAVILAAAATSVPDTVLSVKDAMKGEYDDAVANAVGSNIFDITICLGLPLLAYGLIVGEVHLTASGAAADVQILRWVLLFTTACVLTLLLTGDGIGKMKAYLMFGLYFLWTAFVVGRAMGAGWAQSIADALPGTNAAVIEDSEARTAENTKPNDTETQNRLAVVFETVD